MAAIVDKNHVTNSLKYWCSPMLEIAAIFELDVIDILKENFRDENIPGITEYI